MSVLEQDIDILARVSERVAHAPVAPKPKPAGAETRKTGNAWSLPGILGQTRVSTNFGEVPAQLVRVRDHLRTKDNGYMQVLRIDEYKIDEEFLLHRPDAKPVMIAKTSLGGGMPQQHVYLSPGQQIETPRTSMQHKLVTAGEASAQSYAYDRTVGKLSYFVFHLAKPALIRCEGLWVAAAEA